MKLKGLFSGAVDWLFERLGASGVAFGPVQRADFDLDVPATITVGGRTPATITVNLRMYAVRTDNV